MDRHISPYDGLESRDWRFLLFALDEGHWVSALQLVRFPYDTEDLGKKILAMDAVIYIHIAFGSEFFFFWVF